MFDTIRKRPENTLSSQGQGFGAAARLNEATEDEPAAVQREVWAILQKSRDLLAAIGSFSLHQIEVRGSTCTVRRRIGESACHSIIIRLSLVPGN